MAEPDTVAGAALPTTRTTVLKTEHEGHHLEMRNLNSSSTPVPDTPGSTTEFHDAPSSPAGGPMSKNERGTNTTTSHDFLSRNEMEHLGPATDEPIVHTQTNSGPVLSISLMLITGARHPYKIDEKYLRNRKIEAKNVEGEFDPCAISGYQLKELIWTDWRTEWEPRPASPDRIRLIIMGRMIEDKMALKDFPFNLGQANVVHMTVKPSDLIDDDEAGAGKGTGKAPRARDHDGEGGAGCRCVVQ